MISKENEKLLNTVLQDLHKSTLAIPVLKEYKVLNEKTGALLVAKSEDNSVEQYLEDGQLEENETFKDRLKKVLKETKQSMKKYGFEEKDLKYIETFKGKLFKYELYLQDNIKNNIIVRQINAYFVEPESRYFYEITLSAPAMPLSMVNENVTDNIYARLKVILTNVKYNDKNPLK